MRSRRSTKSRKAQRLNEEVLNLLGKPDWGQEEKRAVFTKEEWSDGYEVLSGGLGAANLDLAQG